MLIELRERAGFGPNSLTAVHLPWQDFKMSAEWNLAFEDHRIWDLKRWRIADQVLNGQANNPIAQVGALVYVSCNTSRDAARDGKYVFDQLDKAPRIVAPRWFQERNYYTFIPQNVLNNNPLIVRNPFQ